MNLSVVLVALVLAAASAAPQQRVVGGEPTEIQNYPYIVAVVYTYPGPGITVQRCVGSLLSSWHVLTSGFCFTGAVLSNMIIRAGSTNSLSGGVLVNIFDFIKHPDYAETPRKVDIAVVTLTTPLGITNNIDILYLPPQGTYIADGAETKVVSWGFEYEGGPQLEFLKTVNLKKLPLAECQTAYIGLEGEAEISDTVICANAPGRGMCLGDSGAPMTLGQTLVGVSSYFYECGNDAIPDVFTRVDRYTDWILEVATAPSADGVPRIAPVA